MKSRIFALIVATSCMFAVCSCNKEETVVTATSKTTTKSTVATTTTEETKPPVPRTFENLIAYMDSCESVQEWYNETEKLGGVKGECWYYIDELQAICDCEVSEEYDIINYTCFQAYTERFDESARIVVSIEIYEIDPDSYLFKKMERTGTLEFSHRSPVRDLENVDWKEFANNLDSMNTLDRMLLARDEETGEIIMSEPEIKKCTPDAINGSFVLVVTSGIETDTGFLALSNSENEIAVSIIDNFLNFGQ